MNRRNLFKGLFALPIVVLGSKLGLAEEKQKEQKPTVYWIGTKVPIDQPCPYNKKQLYPIRFISCGHTNLTMSPGIVDPLGLVKEQYIKGITSYQYGYCYDCQLLYNQGCQNSALSK
jgi:hypothetical protein